MITPDVIKRWLHNQREYDYDPVPATVQVFEDPKVSGTWAVRFVENEGDDDHPVDLLFVTAGEEGSEGEVLARTLEEVEFTTWPPTSGEPRFFW